MANPLPGNPFQPAFAGLADTFIAKLNANGTSLAAATYLGGSYYEYGGHTIEVDQFERVYVSGYTASSGANASYPVPFPVQNPIQAAVDPTTRRPSVTPTSPSSSPRCPGRCCSARPMAAHTTTGRGGCCRIRTRRVGGC